MTPSDAPAPGVAPGISRLFVTVGTDYHRFDRMVWWLDEWLAGDPKVGHVKELRVEYTLDGVRRLARVTEGQLLRLP